MTYRQNNRDTNEAELVELWRACGCLVIHMDRHKGFDLLVICPRTGTHIVEVKNPLYQMKLTQAEKKRKSEVEAIGRVYNIIQNETEARKMIDALQ